MIELDDLLGSGGIKGETKEGIKPRFQGEGNQIIIFEDAMDHGVKDMHVKEPVAIDRGIRVVQVIEKMKVVTPQTHLGRLLDLAA